MTAVRLEGRPRAHRPRRPRESPLFKVLSDHFEVFLDDYEARYQKEWGALRPVVERSVRGYLRCGLLEHGFARLRCTGWGCRREFLLPFSCKVRGLCPSCAAKRAAAWGAWVSQDLARDVPHRHVVVSLPKLLRPYFKFDRSLLTALAGWIYESLRELMVGLAEEPVRPGCVAVLELSGNLLSLNPHVHLLSSSGAFDLGGERFTPLPRGFLRPLESLIRARVLRELHDRGLLPLERLRLLRSWRRSGFSVWVGEPIRAGDRAALERSPGI